MEAAILMVDYLFLLQAAPPVLTPAKRDWFTILTPVLVGLGFVLQQLRSYISAKTATEREKLASMERDNAARIALETKNVALRAANDQAEQIQQVHTLVNGRMSEALDKIATLESRWAKEFPGDSSAQDSASMAKDASRMDIGKQVEAKKEEKK